MIETAPLDIVRMCKRKQFVELREHNQKVITHHFIFQYALAADLKHSYEILPSQCMVGFTATKRLGNAVKRNRVKRRLREMVRLCFPDFALPGYAYVIIGRSTAAEVPFEELIGQAKYALHRAHRSAR